LFQENAFPAPLPRVFNFYPFFIFGYLTAEYNFDFCKKVVFRILSIFTFIGLFIAINYDSVIDVALLSGKRIYSQYHALLGLSMPKLLTITAIRYLVGFLFFLFVMGISPKKKYVGTKLGTNSTYIYILHLFIVVGLTALNKSHHIIDFCTNEIFAVLLLVLTIPVSYLLVSSPVMKATRWLVAPRFDLKNVIERIIK
jgi:fucose 4-O-acetylase-like acetyltransferase